MIYACDLVNIGPVLGIYFWLIIGTDDEVSVWYEKNLLGSLVCGYNSLFKLWGIITIFIYTKSQYNELDTLITEIDIVSW